MSPDEIAQALERSILKALPDADVTVGLGSPGHYTLQVHSATFEGQSTLQRQRAVYSAIAPWMAGNDAPVHAIDKMVTQTK